MLIPHDYLRLSSVGYVVMASTDMGALTGKAAIVTGAGSGIGRATAIRFVAEGAMVAVNDIDEAAARAVAEEVASAGGRAMTHVGDVGDSAYVDALVAATIEAFGRLDVMHNNAGRGRADHVGDVTDEGLATVMRVNFDSVLYGTRAALRSMADQGGGSIINTASVAAFGAAADRSTYSAAKAAVVSMTKSAAVEYARYGIRVNAICPGPILTPALVRFTPDLDFYAAQIPMRRLGTPEEVAALAVFLASDESRYISGTAIPIDGALMARIPAPHLRLEDLTS